MGATAIPGQAPITPDRGRTGASGGFRRPGAHVKAAKPNGTARNR
jgi:hypothetical protein